MLGKSHSGETRYKISISQKGVPKPDWLRKKYSEAKLRSGVYPRMYKWSEEVEAAWREKQAQAKRTLWAHDVDYAATLRQHLAELNASPEQRFNSSKGGNAVWRERREEMLLRLAGARAAYTDETKRKLSESAIAQWTSDKRGMILAQRRGMKRPNKVEQALDELLAQNFPGRWKYVGNGGCVIGNLVPDFLYSGNAQAVIELFGDYWHKERPPRPFSTALERDRVYSENGYKMLVIWESELKSLPAEVVCKRVAAFELACLT